jgi:GcrA cell cycle regulator
MLWTEEAIEVLKTLALEGRSARMIAEALGAPSRAAVIGKANRVGIKLNGGAGGAAPARTTGGAERPRPAAIPRSKSLSCKDGSKPISCKAALVPAPPPQPRKARWIFAEAEVGEMRRVGFAEIREANCRWPLGDPLSDDFAYCGLQPAPGHSYCAGHCRMAYQGPKAGIKEGPREGRRSREPATPSRPP